MGALVAAGFVSLDEQADALGLSRSTTWTIIKGKHKNYGISSALIKRILDKRDLHLQVRIKIVEYIREKAAGSYGHNPAQLRRFIHNMSRSTSTLAQGILLVDLGANHKAPQAAAAEERGREVGCG